MQLVLSSLSWVGAAHEIKVTQAHWKFSEINHCSHSGRLFSHYGFALPLAHVLHKYIKLNRSENFAMPHQTRVFIFRCSIARCGNELVCVLREASFFLSEFYLLAALFLSVCAHVFIYYLNKKCNNQVAAAITFKELLLLYAPLSPGKMRHYARAQSVPAKRQNGSCIKWRADCKVMLWSLKCARQKCKSAACALAMDNK